MCDPITILAIGSLAVGLVSGGLTAMGQVQAGNAAEAQANFQSDVARNNAITLAAASRDAYDRGDILEENLRLRAEDLKGRQRAAFASNGFALGAGSALTVLEDTAELTELDALTIRNNAEREAMGLQTQSNQFLAQSALYSSVGASAKQAGRIGAFSTVLGTASSTAFQGIQLKSLGAFNFSENN